MPTVNLITLRVIDGTWHAIFEGPIETSIVDALGTAIVPTPFTASTPPWIVQREIAHRNEDCWVTFQRERKN